MAYGLVSSGGIIFLSALCARLPCPISLRLVPRAALASPVAKGGKPQVFVFPSNAARHSFGTYHLFHFRNPGETAIQLGHKGNPSMLWEHYANPTAEEHAEAFWAIRSGKAKVVSITKGRRTA